MDSISNYYEKLVFDEIANTCKKQHLTLKESDIQDIACVALNQLPPRYIRHQVDTLFYMEDKESVKINRDVKSAVDRAIDKVINNPR